MLAEMVAGAQPGQQAFGGQRCLLTVGIDQQDDEFVAAQSGNGVFGTHAFKQAHGGLLEQLVAGFVTERVVDHLEVVEVDEHHTDTLARALGMGQRQVQTIIEERAVG